ncbi:DUF6713 family protein [Dysgonomonas termitidis]|uniref:DUF6713 family protein n=1 Tax=Dysgonomonas termitidis TaxID=1516126 RepID=A0ABV9KWI7_9BACT
MKDIIIIVSVLNVIFFIMHEFDAFYHREWIMFKFLRHLKENTQFLIFLYLHIPLLLLIVYYLWSVYNLDNIILWIVWNILMIAHLVIHLFALRWKTTVFNSVHSFILIGAAASTGLVNLLLVNYY